MRVDHDSRGATVDAKSASRRAIVLRASTLGARGRRCGPRNPGARQRDDMKRASGAKAR